MPVIFLHNKRCRLPICLFLALVLITLPSAVHSASIELWHAHQARNFIESVIEVFEEEAGIDAKVVAYSPDSVKAELLLNSGSGLLPDVIIVPSDFLGLYHELRLASLPPSWNLPTTGKQALGTTQINSNQYGIPIIQGNHLMLFYNKRFVDKPASTWKELLEKKQALEAKNISTIGWNYGEMYWFVSFLGAFGGWPMDAGKITLNTPELVRTLPFYQSLSSRGLLPQHCDYSCAQRDFVNGKFAYAINGDWAYADFKKELGQDLGLALLPTIEGIPMQPMSSTYVLAFPLLKPNSEKYEILLELARLFQREDIQRQIYDDYQLLPINKTVYEQVSSQASGDARIILEQLNFTRPMPSDPGMSIAWQAMSKGYQRYMNHGFSAEDAAAYMQNLAEREYERFMQKK